jgi:hypothetical protein
MRTVVQILNVCSVRVARIEGLLREDGPSTTSDLRDTAVSNPIRIWFEASTMRADVWFLADHGSTEG